MIRIIIKLLLLVAVGVAVVKGGILLFQHRELTQKGNRGTAAFENKNYQEAIALFEEVSEELSDHDSTRAERVRRSLARSYKKKADDPGLPISKSIELYRKAAEYDESVIKDEMIKRLLD